MRNCFRTVAILLIITIFVAACTPSAPPLETQTPTKIPATAAVIKATAAATVTATLPGSGTATAPAAEAPAALPLITAGAAHTCLAGGEGKIACWGDNQFGQLGGGDGPFRLLEFGPDVEGMTSWIVANVSLGQPVVAMAAGFYHTCAALEDGQVWCWGRNSSGELGNGSTEDSLSPVSVQGLSGPTAALSAGAMHTCALLESGAVQCWGDNSNGQLGSGSTAASDAPVTVEGLDSAVKQLAAGVAYSCAVMEAGDLFCWGSGGGGLFGSGVQSEVSPPTLLDTVGRVERIAAGQYHLCALLEGGSVNCWGGLTSDEDYTPDQPMVISGLADSVTMMSAGGGYTCARNRVGGVKCWGDNYFGQLGDGSDLASREPVEPVGLVSGVATIAAGSGHACAALEDGSIRCWGDASAGQLGDSAIGWFADWNTYISEKHDFSIDFPADWKILEVPNETYLTDVEQIWFASDVFPPPQTGARPEITVTITREDPSNDWQPLFFDHYQSEMVQIGEIEARRISGTNKESGVEETVVIFALESGGYLQIVPNGSPQSLQVFDQMVASITL